MFEELTILKNKFFSVCNSLKDYVSLEDLYAASLHPSILQFLSAKLDLLFEQEKERFLTSFNLLSPSQELDSYFDLIGSAIKRKRRLKKEFFKDLIFEGLEFNLLFLTNPISYSIEYAFRHSEKISKKELLNFLNLLYYGEIIKKTFAAAYNRYNSNGFLHKKIAENSLKKAYAAILTKYPKAFLIGWFQSISNFFLPISNNEDLIPKKYIFLFLFNNDLDIYLNQISNLFLQNTQDEFISFELLKKEMFGEFQEINEQNLLRLKKLYIEEELINNKNKLFNCYYVYKHNIEFEKELKQIENVADISELQDSEIKKEEIKNIEAIAGLNFASEKNEVFAILTLENSIQNQGEEAPFETENLNISDDVRSFKNILNKKNISDSDAYLSEKNKLFAEKVFLEEKTNENNLDYLKEFEKEQKSLKEYFIGDDSKDAVEETKEDFLKIENTIEKFNEAEELKRKYFDENNTSNESEENKANIDAKIIDLTEESKSIEQANECDMDSFKQNKEEKSNEKLTIDLKDADYLSSELGKEEKKQNPHLTSEVKDENIQTISSIDEDKIYVDSEEKKELEILISYEDDDALNLMLKLDNAFEALSNETQPDEKIEKSNINLKASEKNSLDEIETMMNLEAHLSEALTNKSFETKIDEILENIENKEMILNIIRSYYQNNINLLKNDLIKTLQYNSYGVSIQKLSEIFKEKNISPTSSEATFLISIIFDFYNSFKI